MNAKPLRCQSVGHANTCLRILTFGCLLPLVVAHLAAGVSRLCLTFGCLAACGLLTWDPGSHRPWTCYVKAFRINLKVSELCIPALTTACSQPVHHQVSKTLWSLSHSATQPYTTHSHTNYQISKPLVSHPSPHSTWSYLVIFVGVDAVTPKLRFATLGQIMSASDNVNVLEMIETSTCCPIDA